MNEFQVGDEVVVKDSGDKAKITYVFIDGYEIEFLTGMLKYEKIQIYFEECEAYHEQAN